MGLRSEVRQVITAYEDTPGSIPAALKAALEALKEEYECGVDKREGECYIGNREPGSIIGPKLDT